MLIFFFVASHVFSYTSLSFPSSVSVSSFERESSKHELHFSSLDKHVFHHVTKFVTKIIICHHHFSALTWTIHSFILRSKWPWRTSPIHLWPPQVRHRNPTQHQNGCSSTTSWITHTHTYTHFTLSCSKQTVIFIQTFRRPQRWTGIALKTTFAFPASAVPDIHY